jgi:hypothetical protein
MAVKEVNKSEEIRKLHASGIKSGSVIVKKLKARGIKVAPSQVYQIISGKKGAAKKVVHSNGHGDVLDTAVSFVRQAGGMQKARELLAKLALLHE